MIVTSSPSSAVSLAVDNVLFSFVLIFAVLTIEFILFASVITYDDVYFPPYSNTLQIK
ncbi:MAG: hypothetical protein IKE01_05610 [Clostridia bacterium]|nr:hypothetical protein [Clostridia bacterium]